MNDHNQVQNKRPFADSFIVSAKYENGIMTVEYAPISCKTDLVQNYHNGKMETEIKICKADSFRGEGVNWYCIRNNRRCTITMEKALYQLWRCRDNFEEYFK